MTVSLLVLFFLFTVVFAALGVLFLRQSNILSQKDDPRMSRGLQLLQSKIAILESLSDEVETQVKSLNQLLEIKSGEVRDAIKAAEITISKIEQCKQKSLEVAKIFQDKIPHEEILERQNAKKVVQAARMAHQGSSTEDIMQEVGLTRAEVELIVKMNKDELQFSEAELPDWIEEKHKPIAQENAEGKVMRSPELQQLFARENDRAKQQRAAPTKVAATTSLSFVPDIEMPGKNPEAKKSSTVEVQKVIFPRIG